MEKYFYDIGKRDALANLMMMVREFEGDTKKLILELADVLLKHDPEHPHANWVKKNVCLKD